MNKAGILAAIGITLGGIPSLCLKQADNIALCGRQADEMRHFADDAVRHGDDALRNAGNPARHADGAERQIDSLKHSDETSTEDALLDTGIEGGQVIAETMGDDSEENR